MAGMKIFSRYTGFELRTKHDEKSWNARRIRLFQARQKNIPPNRRTYHVLNFVPLDTAFIYKISKDNGKASYELPQMLYTLKEQADKLSAGEISKDDYDRWRYYYPKYDTMQLWAKCPRKS